MKQIKYNYNTRAIGIGLVGIELLLNAVLVLLYFVFKKQLSGLRYEHEKMLLLLAVLPLLSLTFYLVLRNKNARLAKFGDLDLLPFFTQAIASSKTFVKFIIYRIALVFLLIGLANPKIGNKVAEGKSEGIDLVFCIDVSNSMLTEDIKPNRLKRAKRAVEQILDRLHGDRVGMVVFAGEAYVQLPITSDYGAVKLFLSTIDPQSVPVQGTAIGAAIDMAMQCFDFEKEASSKAIVLLTDGENHEDNAILSAEHAADNNVPVHCIAVATEQGAPIPIYENGRVTGFKKDQSGTIIMSRLANDAIAAVARAGKGLYIKATTQDAGVEALVNEIDKQTKKELDSVVYVDYEDRFQWFLGFALLLLVIETLIGTKKSKWFDKLNWFKHT